MCWSARVSLNTYLVAAFGTVFALMNGMPWNIVAWLHLFSLMQLVEYFLWTNLSHPFWNPFYSSLGLLILVLEPIASMFLMQPGTTRNAFLGAYILFLLLILAVYYPWRIYTSVAKNGHLHWFWQSPRMPLVFNIVWIGFFLIPLILSKYYWLAAFGFITVIVSILTYYKYGTWGTVWCWFANSIWLVIIVLVAFDKRCVKGMFCNKTLK
jgi:hypothetical protein